MGRYKESVPDDRRSSAPTILYERPPHRQNRKPRTASPRLFRRECGCLSRHRSNLEAWSWRGLLKFAGECLGLFGFTIWAGPGHVQFQNSIAEYSVDLAMCVRSEEHTSELQSL